VSDIDALLNRRVVLEEELAKRRTELADIDEQINALAGNEEKKTGVVRLMGATLQAKITRCVSVTYSDKNKLSDLVFEREELRPLFRIDIRESGTRVNKWLTDNATEDLAAELKSIRQEKASKPTVEIQAIVTDPTAVDETADNEPQN